MTACFLPSFQETPISPAEEGAMSVLDFIILLIIAGICGAIGKAITGYWPGGFLVSIVLGFIGALLGLWIARTMGLPELFAIQVGGASLPIIWSIIGAALLIAVISLFGRRRYY